MSSSAPDWLLLPGEVLRLVLKRLTQEDKLRVSQTCQLWYQYLLRGRVSTAASASRFTARSGVSSCSTQYTGANGAPAACIVVWTKLLVCTLPGQSIVGCVRLEGSCYSGTLQSVKHSRQRAVRLEHDAGSCQVSCSVLPPPPPMSLTQLESCQQA